MSKRSWIEDQCFRICSAKDVECICLKEVSTPPPITRESPKMKLKPPGNPQIETLRKSTQRSGSCTTMTPVVRDGVPHCTWCGINPLVSKRHKYCSKACSDALWSFLNPNSDLALQILLDRQDFKCNDCNYSWAEELKLAQARALSMNLDPSLETANVFVIRDLKARVPRDRRIEIDHIVAVALGGPGLGQDNHQALCRVCHANKTKLDMQLIRRRRK